MHEDDCYSFKITVTLYWAKIYKINYYFQFIDIFNNQKVVLNRIMYARRII